ncbi:sensor histidine kinase [Streptomyces palmae]|uniref:histidine kinase n=1 Tax=Streptomyces palmae TaxID=1701085 RepID=A0A4Z0FU61_9ACTN|nr:histidine kinase [Streptomyces palmae]TGA86540.1 two-component sensor histidine kinase [Streptomyces palmae]
MGAMPPLPPLPGRPRQQDLGIAGVGLLGGLVLWGLGLHGATVALGMPAWCSLVSLVVLSGCETLRRTAPGIGLAIGTAAYALDVLAGSLISNVVMFTDLVYTAVLYGRPAAARLVPRVAELLTVLATVIPLAVLRRPEALLTGVMVGVIAAGPAWTGMVIRNHKEAAEAARLRAEQTALLAEMDRVQAVTTERARMARELHDMVAGHLSAIAIHSTAALSLADPAADREALGVIRENSVRGLAEMRRLIGLLRDAGADAEPAAAPTLEGLAALLRQTRAAAAAECSARSDDLPGTTGLEFRLRDRRPAAADPLPAPVELAAYRIVQEALTNALKHAAPGEVLVELDRGPLVPGPRGAAGGARSGEGTPLRVTVVSPLGRAPVPRAPGSGAGLIGMRERVSLLGGEFTAGPEDGSWRVRAVLPVTGGEGDR